jgi:hypothetical protein
MAYYDNSVPGNVLFLPGRDRLVQHLIRQNTAGSILRTFFGPHLVASLEISVEFILLYVFKTYAVHPLPEIQVQHFI